MKLLHLHILIMQPLGFTVGAAGFINGTQDHLQTHDRHGRLTVPDRLEFLFFFHVAPPPDP